MKNWPTLLFNVHLQYRYSTLGTNLSLSVCPAFLCLLRQQSLEGKTSCHHFSLNSARLECRETILFLLRSAERNEDEYLQQEKRRKIDELVRVETELLRWVNRSCCVELKAKKALRCIFLERFCNSCYINLVFGVTQVHKIISFRLWLHFSPLILAH